jgi:glutamate formiminotransferase
MIIECIPNVSEGCRLDVVADMAEVIRKAGVRLLDHSADPSHNRSVFTFVGDATGVERAVLALFTLAVAAIDLRTHRGVHPRVGAVDVVPFVPIADAGMADCVALARRVGATIADRFHVPVYLYEEAATQPTRRHLENIRRGQFEGLAAKMATAGWEPDFGPSRPHPTAGASVIGARMPLIAYNINLNTDRLEVAKAIAAVVRYSSGGFPFVKAMGVSLAHRGIVQVSMNLTNYEQTPIVRVFDAVEREAGRLGVSVLESELIGLIPAAALASTSPAYLKLGGFNPEQQILENKLKAEN